MYQLSSRSTCNENPACWQPSFRCSRLHSRLCLFPTHSGCNPQCAPTLLSVRGGGLTAGRWVHRSTGGSGGPLAPSCSQHLNMCANAYAAGMIPRVARADRPCGSSAGGRAVWQLRRPKPRCRCHRNQLHDVRLVRHIHTHTSVQLVCFVPCHRHSASVCNAVASRVGSTECLTMKLLSPLRAFDCDCDCPALAQAQTSSTRSRRLLRNLRAGPAQPGCVTSNAGKTAIRTM